MYRSAVTLCGVKEAAAGPFVFHGELARGFEHAARHGFDAVELFLPEPDAVSVVELREFVASSGLAIAAFGTGAGWLRHGLSLTAGTLPQRRAALDYILRFVDLANAFAAPVIIGSMQGRWSADLDRDAALECLADALRELSQRSAAAGQPVIYEPLNRYETNLLNTLESGAVFLQQHGLNHVKLLADLFHMNIEEVDIAAALVAHARWVGHIHFADSNRRAMGFGHTAITPLAQALVAMDYRGYLSAEVLPLPNADLAAQQFITAVRGLDALAKFATV